MNRYRKIFGVGPLGALISVSAFLLAWLVDRLLDHPQIVTYPFILRGIAGALVLSGLCLHFWNFFTLGNWWQSDRLCTGGPFKYFRHPMYAARVTFIALGMALFFNSWVFLACVLLLHPIWHLLVKKEERMVEAKFGKAYQRYCARTGRFVPRLYRRGNVDPELAS